MTSPTAATRPLLKAFVVFFALIALVGTFLFVTQQSAGEGPRAAQAKVLGNRVVGALDSFQHLNRGSVPDSIAGLRDLGLLAAPAFDDFAASKNPTFKYVKNGPTSYSLSFDYTGPGYAHCEYVNGSDPNEWKCSRHF